MRALLSLSACALVFLGQAALPSRAKAQRAAKAQHAAKAQRTAKAERAAKAERTAASPARLTRTITRLLSDPAAARAHWGIAVVRLDGRPVYSLHEGQLFRPASTAKLFTTAAAMALLGPDAHTVSRVRFAAPTPDGTVAGDLTLQGGNDADLSGNQPPWLPPAAPGTPPPPPLSALHSVEALAAQIASRGVHHIAGSIVAPVVWDPYPQGWAQEDVLWGYGAPISATSLNDNQLRLQITGGAAPGAPATVTLTPDIGFYRLVGTVQTSAAELPEVTVHHDLGDGQLRLQGSIGVGKVYKTEIAVDDPALFTAQALQHALTALGVTADGTARAPRTELPDLSFLHHAREPLTLPSSPETASQNAPEIAAETNGIVTLSQSGPTLAQDVTATLKESLNLHAELLLRRLGALAGGDGSTLAGARVEHQWLQDAGFSEPDIVLFDGSGLSTKDLVTPASEATLLLLASHQPWFAQWKAALPVGGVDGTLQNRFSDPHLKGRVVAKTGTLGESRALAGYLRCQSGAEVAFSIMVDNHEPGTQADRTTMDDIVTAIAALN